MSDVLQSERKPVTHEPLRAYANDLNAVMAETFRLFSRGVGDRRSVFRTPTIVTVGAKGAPRARTMVLRGFDPAARIITLHTDLRAGKIQDLAHNNATTIHVYDARKALQVRLAAQAHLHTADAVAQASWAASAPASRAVYAVSPAPGTEVSEPPQVPLGEEADFRNFAVLALTFHTLEWLWLHHAGHRRARFEWADDGALRSTWLVP